LMRKDPERTAASYGIKKRSPAFVSCHHFTESEVKRTNKFIHWFVTVAYQELALQ